MKASPTLFELIRHFENYFEKSYLCPAKVWTIGWGSTHWEDGRLVMQGETIDPAHAEHLLRMEVAAAETVVATRVTHPLVQYQFDALVSFVYNAGAGAFTNSTLRRVINAGNPLAAHEQFPRWIKVKGEPSAGLLRRRLAESALFGGYNWEAFRR